MKVTIRCISACYVEEWNDGEPCPNNCSIRQFPDKETAISTLRAEDVEEDEIDVDPYEYQQGWWLTEEELTFDSKDGYSITVE